ncbi:tetratricopeptide repeat protein [bacterium]|nr:tetratricopeptide repeat protein [bacterium]
MQKKAGRILTALMLMGAMSTMAYGITNPIKNYDLYADTHNSSSNTDNTMSDYYRNSLAGQRSSGYNSTSSEGEAALPDKLEPLPLPPAYDGTTTKKDDKGKTVVRRNDYLRESSQKVYSNSSVPAGWTEGPSFYENPSFASIQEKYRKSNFAGCLQECISYVRLHPNDTLGFYYLAMCYAKTHDQENAIKAYEKVIELNANPMIVKYATNGRNCVMDKSETCYENVNEPELIYPYEDLAEQYELTPVDPETLVQRNLKNLQGKLSPISGTSSDTPYSNGEEKENKVSLPFGNQDSELDQFINSPYGNGLAPSLNNEYKGQQLKKLQESINNDSNTRDRNLESIRTFDKSKSK